MYEIGWTDFVTIEVQQNMQRHGYSNAEGLPLIGATVITTADPDTDSALKI